jgi:hypothetical protein
MKKWLWVLLFFFSSLGVFGSFDAFTIRSDQISLSFRWHFTNPPDRWSESEELWRLLEFCDRLEPGEAALAVDLSLLIQQGPEGITVHNDDAPEGSLSGVYPSFDALIAAVNRELLGIDEFYPWEASQITIYRVLLPFQSIEAYSSYLVSSQLSYAESGGLQQSKRGYVLQFFHEATARTFIQDYGDEQLELTVLNLPQEEWLKVAFGMAEDTGA